MKTSAVKNITLASYDDIFQTETTRQGVCFGQITEMPLDELHSFQNHPFKVRDDDFMRETAESIGKYGVLVPGIARPRESGGYELVAGHRRKRGCELVGKNTMPVIVRKLDDDEATIIMVDSNLQRETLLPSERAFAYKMKLDALNHRGVRTDLTAFQLGNMPQGKLSVEIVAEQSGESKNQIFRYIRLTALIPVLLNMVDGKEIAFNPAVELSYLTHEEQTLLLDSMEKEVATPSLSQAQRLKKLSQSGELTPERMDAIMSEEKKPAENKVTLSGNCLKKYFPSSCTPKQMEDTIIKLLENWYKKRQTTRVQ